MSVCLIDKRLRGQQIPSVEMPNHTWFCVLDIDGMDTLVDTRHYCDTATATPAKAKKMAALIENWTPPDGWCNGNDRDWHEKMKGYICDFLRKVWRAAKAMGYQRCITYTQADESGASLRAAGFVRVKELPPRKSWAESSVALRSKRDPVGNGGVPRVLWEIRIMSTTGIRIKGE